jgi:hypothetical protein
MRARSAEAFSVEMLGVEMDRSEKKAGLAAI